jgi:lysyl-tRNA synthetase class 1
MSTDPDTRELAAASQAWPFEEARKIVDRVARSSAHGDAVVFETGYGPSGLPHIGTFGEVARTAMVRHAFATLSDVPTRLVCFSDDMDGLRKVPDNIPNPERMEPYLGLPLTRIPDPFGTHESFGHHNNARLRGFLDAFGFDYEFASSTEYYASGRFDAALLRMLECFDEVMAIMLPSLREERAATYSPFLPLHPVTGVVMQVPIDEVRPGAGTLVWRDPESGERFESPVTGGHCKLQWKPDWAMRWHALGVDYEMSGKDLIDSVRQSSEICRALGSEPPESFTFELFLDEHGQKISKSKGNGLTIEEWLTYASPESLQFFMFTKPREAKRLYFDVIPRTVDEYLSHLAAFPLQDAGRRLANPVWHIHEGDPPPPEELGGDGATTQVSFALLLNLVAVANTDSRDVLWAFLRRYAPGVSPATHPRLDALVGYALRYYADFVKPAKRYRLPDAGERDALARLSDALAGAPDGATPDDLQAIVYDVGRSIERYQDPNAKGATPDRPGVSLAWFIAIYQVLLGEEHGPRLGSFIALYGVEETRALIATALAGELVAGDAPA